MPDIIYILPADSGPVGGVKVQLQHVRMLRQAGFSAEAYALANFHDWYDAGFPVTIFGQQTHWIRPGSIVVFPETELPRLKQTADWPDIWRIIFCQNHYLANSGGLARRDRYGIHGVFSCSAIISTYLEAHFGLGHVPVVPNAIDRGVFGAAGTKRPGSIAYMPRKYSNAVGWLRDNVPEAAACNWLPLHNLSQTEVASELGQAEVFLALSYREGFGLPPLEAMASDCIVAGFHGDGGREYATSDNGFWHDEDDFIGVAGSLKRAVAVAGNRDAEWAQMIQAGRRTADAYSMSAMNTVLIDYWRRQITALGCSVADYMA